MLNVLYKTIAFKTEYKSSPVVKYNLLNIAYIFKCFVNGQHNYFLVKLRQGFNINLTPSVENVDASIILLDENLLVLDHMEDCNVLITQERTYIVEAYFRTGMKDDNENWNYNIIECEQQFSSRFPDYVITEYFHRNVINLVDKFRATGCTERKKSMTNEILNLTFYTDEAWFHLSGYVNSQNFRIWSTNNPYEFIETPLHAEKIGVWAAMSRRKIIGPIFFDETVNATVVVITEDVQNVHLLLEYRPHIDDSLTCEHDPKLQEYCVCPQNMPQFDSEGIPNQAPETNKPMILNGPTSRNREGVDQVSVEAKQLGHLYLSIDQETFDSSTGEPYD
ncbi:hypothetical protein ANN_11087 [Periplaneta americana]|uniref:Uncharacterized protein n=1 Tax=Periplaneta americana TaxID=6978 RepID=A0ABQ8T410_PERAM|nr:hypothetical protein ANN_11087 [Periplaneta americana]